MNKGLFDLLDLAAKAHTAYTRDKDGSAKNPNAKRSGLATAFFLLILFAVIGVGLYYY